jgi:hypothetical protein
MDEALDRIITEFIIRYGTAVTERQIRIDSFLRIAGLTMGADEIAGIVETTGIVRIQLEAMENDLIRVFKESIVSGAQSGRGDVQKQGGASALYRWQVESAKPCPDCIARNGQIETYAYWEAVGLPQTGTTICGKNCKCVIVEEK